MVGMLEAASIKLEGRFDGPCASFARWVSRVLLSCHGGHANLLESREMLVLGDELNVATLTSWCCLSCGLGIHPIGLREKMHEAILLDSSLRRRPTGSYLDRCH